MHAVILVPVGAVPVCPNMATTLLCCPKARGARLSVMLCIAADRSGGSRILEADWLY